MNKIIKNCCIALFVIGVLLIESAITIDTFMYHGDINGIGMIGALLFCDGGLLLLIFGI